MMDRAFARWTTHAMKPHEWGTRRDGTRRDGPLVRREYPHLIDDETVAKMGTRLCSSNADDYLARVPTRFRASFG
jgi:hypothetical protein